MKQYPRFLCKDMHCDECNSWNLMIQTLRMAYDKPMNYPGNVQYDETKMKPEEITF